MQEFEKSARAANLAKALGLSRTASALLTTMGLHEPEVAREFLKPRLSKLTPPDSMADRQVAAERLARAIRGAERICVFGDYDCDGITSAAIMTHALRTLGGSVSVHLANRFDGGYGVSAQAVERIRAQRPSLLVTCDCGSSDAESLHKLAEAKIESIVIDHHLVPSDPLPAVAFLNPRRPDCGFTYKNLASCGLALSVVAAVRSVLNATLDLHSYLDLVAIGTIADVVPLDGDNRILVRAGLDRMSQQPRPGIKALLERARIELGGSVTGEDVAFRIAPRLNAPGRMAAPDIALELLLAPTEDSAEQLADAVEQLQRKRRQVQTSMFDEALTEIQEHAYYQDAAIVVGSDTWSSGIVGILAGKLAEHYGLPVIALAFEGEIGRGSVRAPKGVPLYDILSQLSDCLLRFGGHQAAAGLDVRRDRLAELRQRFTQLCQHYRPPDPSMQAAALRNGASVINEADDLLQLAKDLALFEPCGEGNRQPQLLARGQVTRARAVRGGHLQLEVETTNGQCVRAFGMGLGGQADTLPRELGVIGTLRVTRYLAVERAEMRILSLLTEGGQTVHARSEPILLASGRPST